MRRAPIVTMLGSSCGLVLSVAFAGSAAAETAPASVAAPPGVEDPSTDIVVTAQKRSERLQDVPVSIAVLSGASLQEQGAATLADYVARVPGLSLNARGLGQNQLTIRGLTTGAGYATTVATYIDEAPVGASNGDGAGGLVTPEIDSIDLERIEVLRGPQGTLYGASNIGGLLKYVTVAPDLSSPKVAAVLEGSSVAHGDEGYAVRGLASMPIVTDKVALLASGYVRRDPGVVDDSALNRRNLDWIRTTGWRAALAARPSEQLSINLSAIGTNKSADGFSQVDADAVTLEPLHGDFTQRRGRGSEYQRTRIRLYSGTIAYDMDWAELSSTTSYNTVYSRSSEDATALFNPYFPDGFGNPNPGYAGAYRIDQNKFTEEVRLAGKVGSALDWLVGGYYTSERSDTHTRFLTFDAVTGAPFDIDTLLLDSTITGRYREIAGFAQGTYHLTPEFDITAGLRYADNRQTQVNVSDGLFAGGPSTSTLRATGSATTFTVSPAYKISPDVTLYARVATGYRPGGANSGEAPVLTYGPDRVTNYETGVKGALADGRLSFDIDVFYVDWTNIQLKVVDSSTGLSFTNNVGKASSRGVEANVNYRAISDLTLGVSGTYVDARLDRDIPAGGVYGLKGDVLPYSPKWKVAATADYKRELGEDLNAFAGAGLYYTSAVSSEFRDSATAVRTRLPGYVTIDGRVGVSKGSFSVLLVAKNIFDKIGYNGVGQLTSDDAGPVKLNFIQPRTISLALRFNY